MSNKHGGKKAKEIVESESSDDSEVDGLSEGIMLMASNSNTKEDDTDEVDCDDCAVCKNEPEEETCKAEPDEETCKAEPDEETCKAEPDEETCKAEPEEETCKAEDLAPSAAKPRFKKGDMVKAYVAGKWKSGVVSMLNYEEPGVVAPYQIKLKNGSYVYAPEDSDACIRSHATVQQSCAGPRYRFDVGAKVEAFVEGNMWKPGTVVALDYTEPSMGEGVTAPYQIQLDQGELVYTEDDGSDLVRAAPEGAAVQQSASPFGMYRFARGDRVFANVGDTWIPGTVIKLNYIEPHFAPGQVAPYQILLDNNVKVYAQSDSEHEVLPLAANIDQSEGFLGDMAKKAKEKAGKMAQKAKEKIHKMTADTPKEETEKPKEEGSIAPSNAGMYPYPVPAQRPPTPHSNYMYQPAPYQQSPLPPNPAMAQPYPPPPMQYPSTHPRPLSAPPGMQFVYTVPHH